MAARYAANPEAAAAASRKWSRENPEKRNATKRAWYAKNREKHKATVLRRTYGIAPERYQELLAEQKGVCAICFSECQTGRKLAVDHSHLSGRIRGLLCNRCNYILGLVKDCPALLRRAADYLER